MSSVSTLTKVFTHLSCTANCKHETFHRPPCYADIFLRLNGLVHPSLITYSRRLLGALLHPLGAETLRRPWRVGAAK